MFIRAKERVKKEEFSITTLCSEKKGVHASAIVGISISNTFQAATCNQELTNKESGMARAFHRREYSYEMMTWCTLTRKTFWTSLSKRSVEHSFEALRAEQRGIVRSLVQFSTLLVEQFTSFLERLLHCAGAGVWRGKSSWWHTQSSFSFMLKFQCNTRGGQSRPERICF